MQRNFGKRARSAPVTPNPMIINPSASAQSASLISESASVSRFTIFTSAPRTPCSIASGCWRASGKRTVTGMELPFFLLVARDANRLALGCGCYDRFEHGDAVQHFLRRDRIGRPAVNGVGESFELGEQPVESGIFGDLRRHGHLTPSRRAR